MNVLLKEYYEQSFNHKTVLICHRATVIGLSMGASEIHLLDSNVAAVSKDIADTAGTVKPPTADVHIVTPAYLVISVNPHKNWNVIIGRK